MSLFDIPKSIDDYFDDKKINQSVKFLLARLCSDEVPEVSSRDEAATYNQALLMATHVRTDYVDMLWRIWDETFGAAFRGRRELNLKEEFDPEGSSPAYIWSEHSVYSYILRNKRAIYLDECFELHVIVSNGMSTIGLCAYRYQNHHYVNFIIEELPGWRYNTDADIGVSYLETDQVLYLEFLENPDKYIAKWREASEEMMNFIAATA